MRKTACRIKLLIGAHEIHRFVWTLRVLPVVNVVLLDGIQCVKVRLIIVGGHAQAIVSIFTIVFVVEWYNLLAESNVVETGTSVQPRLNLDVLAELMHVLLRNLKIDVLLLLRLPELATVSAANLRFSIQRRHIVDL